VDFQEEAEVNVCARAAILNQKSWRWVVLACPPEPQLSKAPGFQGSAATRIPGVCVVESNLFLAWCSFQCGKNSGPGVGKKG